MMLFSFQYSKPLLYADDGKLFSVIKLNVDSGCGCECGYATGSGQFMPILSRQ